MGSRVCESVGLCALRVFGFLGFVCLLERVYLCVFVCICMCLYVFVCTRACRINTTTK